MTWTLWRKCFPKRQACSPDEPCFLQCIQDNAALFCRGGSGAEQHVDWSADAAPPAGNKPWSPMRSNRRSSAEAYSTLFRVPPCLRPPSRPLVRCRPNQAKTPRSVVGLLDSTLARLSSSFAVVAYSYIAPRNWGAGLCQSPEPWSSQPRSVDSSMVGRLGWGRIIRPRDRQECRHAECPPSGVPARTIRTGLSWLGLTIHHLGYRAESDDEVIDRVELGAREIETALTSDSGFSRDSPLSADPST